MERLVLSKLLEWKKSPHRKPLILKGIRRVGKTWILKEFGKRYYKNTAYFNFNENEELKNFFETTDVKSILQNLMMAKEEKIEPNTTLIIFDEIQDCPNVIASLKYFFENAPSYHIACATPFLGTSSFPIEKVNFIQINPMTFSEFLLASGDKDFLEYIESVDSIKPISDDLLPPLYERLKMYYITGGMPESVLMWTKYKDIDAMQKALSSILNTYELDFRKYFNKTESKKISLILKSVHSQLAKYNKKFFYKTIKEGARKREYENALQCLIDTKLVHKIYRSKAPNLPLSSYDDTSAFKIYLSDVGLFRRLLKIYPSALTEGNRLFTQFNNSLTENFVLESLIPQFEVTPRYWSQLNPSYEVEFLIQRKNDIFPVEIKLKSNKTSKSMKKFKALFSDKVKLKIRFSFDNLKLDDDILNIPLFMIDQTDKLIGIALDKT